MDSNTDYTKWLFRNNPDYQQKFNWDKHSWYLADILLQRDPDALVKHQLRSFDDFVENVLPYIAIHQDPMKVTCDRTDTRYEYRVVNIYISKPMIHENDRVIPLTPQMCRIRDLTYAAPVFIDIEQKLIIPQGDGQVQEIIDRNNQIPIDTIPIMLGSKYCHLHGKSDMERYSMGECIRDRGGYFIIRGNEKVVVSQERMADNKVVVFPINKTGTKYTHMVEVKSTIDQRFYPIKPINIKLEKEKAIRKSGESIGRQLKVGLPYIKEDIPLFIVFRALGIVSDRDIFNYCLSNTEADVALTNMLEPSCRVAEQYTTREDAIRYISRYINYEPPKEIYETEEERQELREKYTMDIVYRDVLPHIKENLINKAYFLGYMTYNMLYAVNRSEMAESEEESKKYFDDRDHYSNKRLNLAGPLIADIFRSAYYRLATDIRNSFIRKLAEGGNSINNQLREIIQRCSIGSKLIYALATGNWHTSKKSALSSSKKGIAQVVQRHSYLGYISHMRRIQSPLERAGSKLVPPRKLHSSQYGMCCPNETPEGAQVGVVKNLALTAYITCDCSSESVQRWVHKLGVVPLGNLDPGQTFNRDKFLINGNWVGVSPGGPETTHKVVATLKLLKLNHVISAYTSIAWFIEKGEVHIQTDGGRYIRPLLVVTPDGDILFKRKWMENKEYRTKIMTGKTTWDQVVNGLVETDGQAQAGRRLSMKTSSVVEYLDANELECSMVAMDAGQLDRNREYLLGRKMGEFYRYTHLEFHPSLIQGVVSQMIPYSSHNQSPRNCYQCLWKEETVLMADGSRRRIADIKVGDKVITVDTETLERSPATVINQYVKHTDKNIVKLNTITGRELVCTDDHPVLTIKGWKHAGELTSDDRVSVCPDNTPNMVELEYSRLPNGSLSFDEWNDMVEVRGSSIFVPVESVVEHENVEIADITIDRKSHSFITGNSICVHNSSMGKQAMGVYTTNFKHRLDTGANYLIYPQMPVTSTRTTGYTGLNTMPHGAQAIVAIACYGGYNQEDSIIMNKAAIERGLFNSLFTRFYMSKQQRYRSVNKVSETFGIPPANQTIGLRRKKGDRDPYHAINPETGFPIRGTYVSDGDVIISKYAGLETGDQKLYKDVSSTVRSNEEGEIDMVIPNSQDKINNENSEGYKFCKARITQLRKPKIADKLASRSAQKGTIGMVYRQEDMPFTQDGVVPDIIMNPHAIPSRMTNAQILESLIGKAALHEGIYPDATPFNHIDTKQFTEILERNGYDNMGDEYLYNGMNGKMIKVKFYIGPVYYQRLKHMVDDKVHARNIGPVQILTRQPAEGRARDGGLRIGEMERDCFIAHGTAGFFREKTFNSSDAFKVTISKEKGDMIVTNKEEGVYKYGTRDIYDTDEIVDLAIPYAAKLAYQELKSMGIDIHFQV